MAHLTFWFEFASTYSYLSAARIMPLARAKDVNVRWRPFLLGPIFQAQGWSTSPFNIYSAKGNYMWQDMARQITKYGLPPLVKPNEFPQNGLLAARLASVGVRDNWGHAFIRRVYHAQFAQGRTISDESVLSEILEDLDQDPVALIARAKMDAEVKADLRRATDQAQKLGVFGAPSFVTSDGTLFWGDDRLEDALDWQTARM
ncbi:MAG: 2-hydroxychromene-2-carboxylate isomerase [Sedimentitalea sp.]